MHCGFCNATCPTYQLLGDELDGPRGRIYLMKQMFEGGEVTESTQLHLDRCLTCRNCETTCPSGVKYHNLLDIGRDFIERQVQRPLGERLVRGGLRTVIPRPGLFKALLGTGNALKPLMPASLKDHLPREIRPAKPRPQVMHQRRVLMLEGCVQPSLSPNTNAAAARARPPGHQRQPGARSRLLRRGGLPPRAGCRPRSRTTQHRRLVAGHRGRCRSYRADRQRLRRLRQGIRPSAQDDLAYAAKAARVSELAKDLVEVLRSAELEKLDVRADKRMAFHCPCTLQHAQKLGGAVEDVLTRLGYQLTAVPDAHLCCGSAGSYSITQPEISHQLRDNKLNALESGKPEVIVTANIGCQTHLDGAGRTPVKHWIEVVEESMQ